MLEVNNGPPVLLSRNSLWLSDGAEISPSQVSSWSRCSSSSSSSVHRSGFSITVWTEDRSPPLMTARPDVMSTNKRLPQTPWRRWKRKRASRWVHFNTTIVSSDAFSFQFKTQLGFRQSPAAPSLNSQWGSSSKHHHRRRGGSNEFSDV